MKPEQWDELKYFSSEYDNWGVPANMQYEFMLTLDAFREYVNRPIIIHCGYEKRKTGQHPLGVAADLHVEGLSLFKSYIAASRFAGFRGIGLYPWWHHKGLHVDARALGENKPRALWGSTGPEQYVELNRHFLMQAM